MNSIEKQTALRVLFETFLLSPVQFVIMWYWCILWMFLFMLSCEFVWCLNFPSLPFTFLGWKQHFTTVREAPLSFLHVYVIYAECAVMLWPTQFTLNWTSFGETGVNPVLTVKCCSLKTNPLQSTTKRCGCPLLIQVCVCACVCACVCLRVCVCVCVYICWGSDVLKEEGRHGENSNRVGVVDDTGKLLEAGDR